MLDCRVYSNIELARRDAVLHRPHFISRLCPCRDALHQTCIGPLSLPSMSVNVCMWARERGVPHQNPLRTEGDASHFRRLHVYANLGLSELLIHLSSPRFEANH